MRNKELCPTMSSSKIALIILWMIGLTLFTASKAFAWEGSDLETGQQVEIDTGSMVRQGYDVDIYDSITGEQSTIEVESVTNYGDSVVIEAYDYDTGEYRNLEMNNVK